MKLNMNIATFLLTIIYCALSFSNILTTEILLSPELVEFTRDPIPPKYKLKRLLFLDENGDVKKESIVNIFKIKYPEKSDILYSDDLRILLDLNSSTGINYYADEFDSESIRLMQGEDSVAEINPTAKKVIRKLKEKISDNFHGVEDGIQFGYSLLEKQFHIDEKKLRSIPIAEIDYNSSVLINNPEPGAWYIRGYESKKKKDKISAYDIIIYLGGDVFIVTGFGFIAFMGSEELSEFIYNSSISNPPSNWWISEKSGYSTKISEQSGYSTKTLVLSAVLVACPSLYCIKKLLFPSSVNEDENKQGKNNRKRNSRYKDKGPEKNKHSCESSIDGCDNAVKFKLARNAETGGTGANGESLKSQKEKERQRENEAIRNEAIKDALYYALRQEGLGAIRTALLNMVEGDPVEVQQGQAPAVQRYTQGHIIEAIEQNENLKKTIARKGRKHKLNFDGDLKFLHQYWK